MSNLAEEIDGLLDEASGSTIASQGKKHLDALAKAMDARPWDEDAAKVAFGGLLAMVATAATTIGDGPTARVIWKLAKNYG